MYRFSAILLAVVLSSGCASNGLTPDQKSKVIDAQIAQASQPTLEMDCPSGCSIKYTDPRDRGRISLPRETNGWDAMISSLDIAANVALGLGPWYAVGTIAKEGIQAAQGDTTITTTTDAREDTDTTVTEIDERGDTYGNGADLVGRDQIGGSQAGRDQIGGDQTDQAGRFGSDNIRETSTATETVTETTTSGDDIGRDNIGRDNSEQDGRFGSPDDNSNRSRTDNSATDNSSRDNSSRDNSSRDNSTRDNRSSSSGSSGGSTPTGSPDAGNDGVSVGPAPPGA